MGPILEISRLIYPANELHPKLSPGNRSVPHVVGLIL